MKVWLPILVLSLGGGLAYVISETEPGAEEVPEKITTPIVRTLTAKPETHSIEVVGHGTVIPAREITIHPEVVGKLIYVNPKVVTGGFVAKGQQLVSLNPIDYELAVEQQQALVAQAELEQELEQARQKIAEREWQRMGITDAQSTSLANRESYKRSATARLASAKSNVQLAQRQLDRTRVYAPFNAVVQSENVEVGQVVFPQSLLAKLVGTDSYWVIVDIPIHRLPYLELPRIDGKPGSMVEVEQLSGTQTTTFRGRVIRLLSQVEPRARMAQMVIEIEDPLSLKTRRSEIPLFLGTNVKVTIQGISFENVVEIPRKALRDNNVVWLLTDESTLSETTVSVLYEGPNSALINGSSLANANIITSDIEVPIQGMKLKKSKPSMQINARSNKGTTTATVEHQSQNSDSESDQSQ